jgi:tRNA (uracil-5-)-methyltransferase TRM9
VELEIVRRLTEINLHFYQAFAHQFSATRGHLQPGVRRIIDQLPVELKVIDLGCGNGELGSNLAGSGRHGLYVGLDSSNALLEIAAKRNSVYLLRERVVESEHFRMIFLQTELTEPNWGDKVPNPPYNFVLAFAVLHHLPGQNIRHQTLRQVRQLLIPGGTFIHSEWQFLNSPRLTARILPWETAGLTENQVDSGDYLLDWRQGGYGIRYVHHFDESELYELAHDSGFEVESSFLSDGESGKLGLYQVWKVNSDKIK